MKKVFLLGVLFMVTMPVFSSDCNNVKEKVATEDANVTAYRLTDKNGTPLDESDDVHAYFNTLACANQFKLLYPQYENNGKVSVPETQVLTCL